MAYSNRPGQKPTYPALKAWVDRCLRANDSLFTPGRPVWTRDNLEENYRRFVEVYDESSAGYVEKLGRQLAGASDEVIQCAAECEWALVVLAQSTDAAPDLKSSTKRGAVGAVLNLLGEPITLAREVDASFDAGLCNTGLATRTRRWIGRLCLIEFGVQWKRLPDAEREQYLVDPWAFKTWLFSIPHQSGKSMREALLHYVHPETFEIIINESHKDSIVKTFADRSGGLTDRDRALLEIRQSFEAEWDGPFDFYREPIKSQWLPKKPPPPQAPPPGPGPTPPPRPTEPRVTQLRAVTTELADALHLPVDWLQHDIVELLEDKRQIVLYGPPGTGKTWLAMAVAEHLTAEGGERRLIQFHPSYAYEDFFEGFRPVGTGDGGTVRFELVPGPLRQMAEAAAADPDHPYVLVVDELNRANLAKVFGELYFLLEYRDQEIGLQYRPGKSFTLPGNLYLIGTMNTADRSIALVDAAMRRRFYFVDLFPTRPPVDELLADWLADQDLPAEAADLLALLNKRLADEDFSIGPSYLMTERVTEPGGLERIWKRAIMPLLEEHFYGAQRDLKKEFGLESLRSALKVQPDATPAG